MTPEQLQARIAELESTLTAVERRHAIDLALIDADAADLESARLLTEAAVTAMPEADLAHVIADLRARKPFLFRTRTHPPSRTPSASMSTAAAPATTTVDPSHSAALDHDAARAGDRRALLRYLRARRTR